MKIVIPEFGKRCLVRGREPLAGPGFPRLREYSQSNPASIQPVHFGSFRSPATKVTQSARLSSTLSLSNHARQFVIHLRFFLITVIRKHLYEPREGIAHTIHRSHTRLGLIGSFSSFPGAHCTGALPLDRPRSVRSRGASKTVRGILRVILWVRQRFPNTGVRSAISERWLSRRWGALVHQIRPQVQWVRAQR